MTQTIEQEIEKYFGDVLRQHHFQPIYQQTTPVGACVIYVSGFCRFRFVEERTDTLVSVGGEGAKLDASDNTGWTSVSKMIDFLEDKRSVAHLVDWSAVKGYDQEMREMSQGLARHLAELLAWFKPQELNQRLDALEAFSTWRRNEISRYMRAKNK